MAFSFFKESRDRAEHEVQGSCRMFCKTLMYEFNMERLVTEKQAVEEVELEGARETFLVAPHSSPLGYFHMHLFI